MAPACVFCRRTEALTEIRILGRNHPAVGRIDAFSVYLCRWHLAAETSRGMKFRTGRKHG